MLCLECFWVILMRFLWVEWYILRLRVEKSWWKVFEMIWKVRKWRGKNFFNPPPFPSYKLLKSIQMPRKCCHNTGNEFQIFFNKSFTVKNLNNFLPCFSLVSFQYTILLSSGFVSKNFSCFCEETSTNIKETKIYGIILHHIGKYCLWMRTL